MLPRRFPIGNSESANLLMLSLANRHDGLLSRIILCFVKGVANELGGCKFCWIIKLGEGLGSAGDGIAPIAGDFPALIKEPKFGETPKKPSPVGSSCLKTSLEVIG